jgi:hypothetical protein
MKKDKKWKLYFFWNEWSRYRNDWIDHWHFIDFGPFCLIIMKEK